MPQQEYRPDHISGKLEDRVDPQAIADCKAFRDQAWAYVNAEMERINSTCAAHINKSDYFELVEVLRFYPRQCRNLIHGSNRTYQEAEG